MRDAALLQPAHVGVAAQEPEQLVEDRLEVQLLGGEQREAVAEVEAQLPAEHRERAGAGAVGLARAALQHFARAGSRYWRSPVRAHAAIAANSSRRALEALVRVLRQQAGRGAAGAPPSGSGRRGHGSLTCRLDQLRRRWRLSHSLLAGEHLVDDHAQAVEVGARVDGLAEALLRAHVARRREQLAGDGQGGVGRRGPWRGRSRRSPAGRRRGTGCSTA